MSGCDVESATQGAGSQAHYSWYAASWESSRLVFDEVCWGWAELSPESAIWADLSTQEPWGATTELVSFYTSTDCLVRPASSSVIRGADNRERGEETHFSFLWSQSVFSEIFAILQRE